MKVKLYKFSIKIIQQVEKNFSLFYSNTSAYLPGKLGTGFELGFTMSIGPVYEIHTLAGRKLVIYIVVISPRDM